MSEDLVQGLGRVLSYLIVILFILIDITRLSLSAKFELDLARVPTAGTDVASTGDTRR